MATAKELCGFQIEFQLKTPTSSLHQLERFHESVSNIYNAIGSSIGYEHSYQVNVFVATMILYDRKGLENSGAVTLWLELNKSEGLTSSDFDQIIRDSIPEETSKQCDIKITRMCRSVRGAN